MDRRIFEPEPSGGGAHRRAALRLAAAVLGAGWLGLAYLQHGAGLGAWLQEQMTGHVTIWFLGWLWWLVTYLYARLRKRLIRPPTVTRAVPTKRPARSRVRFPAAPED